MPHPFPLTYFLLSSYYGTKQFNGIELIIAFERTIMGNTCILIFERQLRSTRMLRKLMTSLTALFFFFFVLILKRKYTFSLTPRTLHALGPRSFLPVTMQILSLQHYWLHKSFIAQQYPDCSLLFLSADREHAYVGSIYVTSVFQYIYIYMWGYSLPR